MAMKRLLQQCSVLFVALLAACGSSSSETRLNAADDRRTPPSEGRDTSPTTGTEGRDSSATTGPAGKTPPSTRPPSGPEGRRVELEKLLEGNRADRSTGLGQLCWVEREVVLDLKEFLAVSFVVPDKSAEPPPERTRDVIDRFKNLANTAADEMRSSESLDSDVREFQNQLLEGLKQARAILDDLPEESSAEQRMKAFDSLVQVLNFEQYPGVKEFKAEAEANREACPDGL
jgi:hypothetical protein